MGFAFEVLGNMEQITSLDRSAEAEHFEKSLDKYNITSSIRPLLIVVLMHFGNTKPSNPFRNWLYCKKLCIGR